MKKSSRISTLAGLLVISFAFAGGISAGVAAMPDGWAANAGWEEVGAGSATGGGISDNSGRSLLPDLEIAADGLPIIAWMDDSSGDEEVYIKRWTGSAWVEIGSGSASGAGVSNASGYSGGPSLAITSEGVPIVAWNQVIAGKGEIYVRYWNRFSWVEMGVGSASGSGVSQNGNAWDGKIAVGPDDIPVVAYVTNIGGEQVIHVRRWNGTSWGEMGSGSATGGGLINPGGYTWSYSLAITPDNRPIIAWQDYAATDTEIFARIWNGSSWVGIGSSTSSGGISNNGGSSFGASVAVGQDNLPVIVWSDESSGNSEIYARRWNGSVWNELGDGSASGGGISNTSTPSYNATLTITPDNSPIVAWREEISSTNSQIFVRHWNGSAWVEMGSGSASAGGISDVIGIKYSPTIGSGPDNRAMVAWADESSGDFEIYTRHSPQPPVACYRLTSTHTGNGSNPAASPTNSAGCAAGQYIAGQQITLTAAPAAGWRVTGWSGTANDASTATTNSLTMPTADHTVGVIYGAIPVTSQRALVPLVVHVPVPACWPGPHETEPNDDNQTADGPLCSDRTYTGDPNDQWDVFFFDTRRAGPIAVRLENHNGGGVQLSLHDSAFNLITRDFDPSGGFRIDLANQPANRYFIVVHTATPKPGSGERYSLRATFTE